MKKFYKILISQIVMGLIISIIFTGCIKTEDISSTDIESSLDYQNGDNARDEIFRGVYFNPDFSYRGIDGYPFPAFDIYLPDEKERNRKVLNELSEKGINLVVIFVAIPYTLMNPPEGNKLGAPIEEWGNLLYLNNLALFIEDCYYAGISVGLDIVDHRWVPYSAAPEGRIVGLPDCRSWPLAGDEPWIESAEWYTKVIEYVEAKAKYPESIAWWSMMGHFQLGTAEPMLWSSPTNPKILEYTERFVKEVWPSFIKAGNRPKGSPYMLPIFSTNSYWRRKNSDERLEGFRNLKKWIADDLKMPPDYWMMTTYPFCDDADDGVNYMEKIIEILGRENAHKIISTDLKSEGHEADLADTILRIKNRTGAEMLDWNLEQVDKYGFAGWWIWSYQDAHVNDNKGIRRLDGTWKIDLIDVIKSYID